MAGCKDSVLRWALFFSCCTVVFLSGCASKPSPVDSYVDAVVLNGLDKNDQAIAKLNIALKKDPKFSLAYSFKGDIYQQQKKYAKSAASYEKAVAINAWSFHDSFNLAKVYQAMQKYDSAIKSYSRAIELEPGNFQANLNNAQCYHEIKDDDKALEYAKIAEQVASTDSLELRKLLGDIYASRKDNQLAIASYKKVLEADSSNPQTMLSLAKVYLKTELNEPAKQLLVAASELQPQNSDTYKYLGYCLLKLGKLDEAVENYSKAVDINNLDWDAHRGLGVAFILQAKNTGGLMDLDLKAKAVKQWQKSLDIKPDQPNSDKLKNLIEKYSD